MTRVALAKEPKLPGGAGGVGYLYTTTVHAVRYWQVREDAPTLLAWENAHMPRTFSQENVLIGPPSWNTLYTLPPVPPWFVRRELNAQYYDVGGGETVIMTDAAVAWEPPRPATEVIPASVTVVTIAADWPSVSHQATITSVPTVRRLAALVNGLSPSTVGGVLCLGGLGLTLTFSAKAGGPPTAVAWGPDGCGVVAFQLNGKNQPDLMVPVRKVSDPSSYDSMVLKTAGLHWKLP